MEYHDKEVRFDIFCPKCEFNALDKIDRSNSDGTIFLDYCEECHDCLNNPTNTDSHKPVRFKEKN